MCEAAFRRILVELGCKVEPNEDLKGESKAPDFHCERFGNRFYVEVTCLGIEAVTANTGLSDEPGNDTVSVRLMNDMIFNAAIGKVEQCANLDAPCLVAVGTWHFYASMAFVNRDALAMVLTGKLGVSWRYNSESGEAEGEPREVTNLKGSAFVRPGKADLVDMTRLPISAILVGGLGLRPPRVLGLLHPEPVRPLDPRWLPQLSFCRLLDGSDRGLFTTEWIEPDVTGAPK